MASSSSCGASLDEQNSATANDDKNIPSKTTTGGDQSTARLQTESPSGLVPDIDLASRDEVQKAPEEDHDLEDLGAIQELIKALSVAQGAGKQECEDATRSLMLTLFHAVRRDNVSLYKVILSSIGDMADMSIFGDFQTDLLISALSMRSFKCTRHMASIIEDVNMCRLLPGSSFDSETFQILFGRGFKIESCPCKGMCCLIDIICSKDEQMVQLCLENGCVANHPPTVLEMSDIHPLQPHVDCYDFSPLLCAVLYGNLETVKILLEHNADIKKEEDYDMSPIEAAVYVANPRMLEIILKTYQLSAEGQDQSNQQAFRNDVQHALNVAVTLTPTPLIAQCVKILFDFGAAVNGVDDKGILPILASIQNKNENSLRVLLQQGSDVNAVGNVEKHCILCEQISPLRLSTELLDDNILSTLLKAGAIVQSEDMLSEEAQKRITKCKKNFSLADWSRLSVRKHIQPFCRQDSVEGLEIPLILKNYLNMM